MSNLMKSTLIKVLRNEGMIINKYTSTYIKSVAYAARKYVGVSSAH